MQTAPTMMLPTVNAARAFAALAVLMFHLTILCKPDLLWRVFSLGVHGIDLFFVISGFIMVYTNDGARGSRAAWRFCLRRMVRIYPPYWIVAAIVWWAGWHAMPADWLGTLLLYNFTFDEGRLQQSAAILPQAWTMSIEVAFYLFFASFFFVGKVGFAILCAGWAILVRYNYLYPWYNGVILNSLVPDLFLGVLTAYIVVALKGMRMHGAWPLLAALLVSAVFFLDPFGYIPRVWPVLTYGPSCAVLLGTGALWDVWRHPMYPRWMMTLGDASYAIYLVHYVQLTAVNYVLMHYVRDSQLGAAGGAGGVVLVCAALIVLSGVLFQRWIERPVVDLAKSYLMRLNRPRRYPAPEIP